MIKQLSALLSASMLSFSAASSPTPSNVILIIGDGMDDQQITIARNYLRGASGQLTLDTLPSRSAVQVLTVSEQDPKQPVYVADSANSATAMATGVVTSRGRISTSANSDRDLPTIVELAHAAGYKTGIVSTASVTDATPAAFAAHIDKRFCENPAMMVDGLIHGRFEVECEADTKANGGLGSIAEQLAASNVDVIFGGGYKHFDTPAEGTEQTVLAQAQANGFYVLKQAQQLANLPQGQKVLGLFSPSTMPVRLQGEGGRIAEPVQHSLLNKVHKYMGEVTLPAPMRCEPNPAHAAMPSLQAMTAAAIGQLENERGFFLVVESASIDKESHSRNPCGSIGELEQLDEVVQLALGFAKRQPNTLILVTADHGQAAQLIPQVSMFSTPNYGGLPVATPGAVARIITPEGAIMGVNYATNESFAEEHTGVNVALFSNDVGKALLPPMLRQPDIFTVSREFLGL